MYICGTMTPADSTALKDSNRRPKIDISGAGGGGDREGDPKQKNPCRLELLHWPGDSSPPGLAAWWLLYVHRIRAVRSPALRPGGAGFSLEPERFAKEKKRKWGGGGRIRA